MRFFLLFLLIAVVFCVDRSNFRTCENSSFCMRQRNYWPSAPKYHVDSNKILVNANVVEFQIIDTESQKRLNASITYHPGNTFRLLIDEAEPIRPRFRPRIGDALVREPQNLPINIHTSESEVAVSTQGQNKAIIQLKPFKISFYSKNGLQVTVNDRDLFNFEHQLEQQFEYPTPPPTEDPAVDRENNTDNESPESAESTAATEPPSTNPIPVDWSEHFKGHRDSRPHGPTSIGIDFTFHGFEYVFGIPEHADSFALRNTNQTDPYRLYNLDVFEYELNNPMALYGSVPLMWAHKLNDTVGLFFHNPTEAWIDVQSSRNDDSASGLLSNLFSKSRNSSPSVKTRWMFETGVVDVFIILADNPHSGLKSYTGLTGITPLPPLFALAHHQSRWNYRDENEVKTISDDYNKHNLPVDVIWLDIEHANDKRYLTWDTGKFSTPDAMIDDLSANGRKLVVAVDPHIKADLGWSTCSNGKDAGLYVKKSDGVTDFDGWCWPGSSFWPDFYRAEVVDWWANLFTGNAFVSEDRMFHAWNDMGEPSVFSGPEVSIPKDTIFGGLWENRDLHNLYGLWVHNATWEGLLRRSNRHERPFVLTRAFFAGSQRTSAVWSGDNTASWEHLQICTPMLLSMSITGLTFCGTDVGGFFGHPSGELYTRWYQAAAFHPFLRSHAHIDTPKREPWMYEAKYLEAIREALRIRYSMLPYWYTLFAVSETDASLPMAPLFYHFPEDERTFGIDDAFMVGGALLVHPVVHEGANSVDVYLPQGTWYLHDDWKVYSGCQVVRIPVELQTIPLFYRGGFIIPKKSRPRRSSEMMVNDYYTIMVILDASNSDAVGHLYLDDFHSTDRNEARMYRMDYNHTNKTSAVFEFTQLSGSPGASDQSQLIERIVIMGARLVKPNRVFVTGDGPNRDVEFFYSPPESNAAKLVDGSRSALLVLRKPGMRSMSGWQLHVQG